jgi:hypothetical protein
MTDWMVRASTAAAGSVAIADLRRRTSRTNEFRVTVESW